MHHDAHVHDFPVTRDELRQIFQARTGADTYFCRSDFDFDRDACTRAIEEAARRFAEHVADQRWDLAQEATGELWGLWKDRV